MDFFTTYGVEFTYLLQDSYYKKHKSERRFGYYYDSEYTVLREKIGFFTKALKLWDKANKRKIINYLNIHNDCDALEICSPIFNNIEDVRAFYTAMDETALCLGLVTHRESTGGGGGHIHAGIPKSILKNKKKLSLFIANIYRDMSNRPYLNALFNEYVDDHSACQPRNGIGIMSKIVTNPKLDTPEKIYSEIQKKLNLSYNYGNSPFNMSCKKLLFRAYCVMGYVNIQYQYKTVEFRIFDMPKSLDRLEKHLRFVDAYMRYIVDITLNNKLVPIAVKNLKDWKKYRETFLDVDKTKKEFKDFLKQLGLNYTPYRYLLKENFLKRLAAGYKIN
jgi:hypothetical protein